MRPELTSGFFVTRLVRGFGYPMRGLRFVYREHPKLIRYTLLQVLVTILVLGGVIAGVASGQGAIVNALWAQPASGVLHWIWYGYWALTLAAMLVAGYFVFTVLTTIVCAPFNSKLSARVESIVTGRPPPETGLGDEVREVLRDIRVALGRVLVYGLIMLPLLLVGLLIPGVGQVVLVGAGGLFTALYLSLDYLDWPMSRRRIDFGERLRYLGRNLWPLLGFGGATFLLLFVPVLSFFLVPAAVTGGTLLFLDLGDRVELTPPSARR